MSDKGHGKGRRAWPVSDCEADKAKALHWYELAAAQGGTFSMNNIGVPNASCGSGSKTAGQILLGAGAELLKQGLASLTTTLPSATTRAME